MALPSLCLNSRILCAAPCPQVQGSAIINFGMVDSKLVFGIYDRFSKHRYLLTEIVLKTIIFLSLSSMGASSLQDSVCLPFGVPLLLRKGATKSREREPPANRV